MKTRCIDISDWYVQLLQPVVIGKRTKYTCYPSDKPEPEYYFKKPDPRYPWEFWCEVAASRIGELLKFNVAEYHVAFNIQGEVGCISESIITPGAEFIHGQQFLLRIKPDFEVKSGSDHSFQLVEEFFLSKKRLQPLLKEFIVMLVFDALVGNHDRHQQNWAILRTINVNSLIDKKGVREGISAFVKLVTTRKNPDDGIDEIYTDAGFSKIFDSGNCLGYNYTEEKIIEELLGNDAKFNEYVNGNRAVGHLRWNADRLKYVDLLFKIKEKYPIEIKSGINQVMNNFDFSKVEEIIMNLDSEFPSNPIYANYKLTSFRKLAMKKLLQARFELLKPLFK